MVCECVAFDLVFAKQRASINIYLKVGGEYGTVRGHPLDRTGKTKSLREWQHREAHDNMLQRE